MSRKPSRIDSAIRDMAGALQPLCRAGYLYGSQLEKATTRRDVDLLLITDSSRRSGVFCRIAEMQIRSDYLIHPTVITVEDYDANRLFRKIRRHARSLW